MTAGFVQRQRYNGDPAWVWHREGRASPFKTLTAARSAIRTQLGHQYGLAPWSRPKCICPDCWVDRREVIST